MRSEFVEAKTRKDALKSCPWASFLSKVNGGYMCFESYGDYRIYINQK